MKILNKNGYVTKQTFNMLKNALTAAPPAILADGVINTISDLIRYNTILSVARAGTGHLGASLSIIEILTCIYYLRFDFDVSKKDDNNRDIFILSKGHAVPALYATLASKGYIGIEKLDNLRRLGGLQGHCDISTPGIEANTGSLAMGISRAAGYALAKKRMGYDGSVIVIAGDGELQEGQVWEALLSAVSFELSNLYIIIDNNSVQTDQYVRDIIKYNDLCRTMNGLGCAALSLRVSSATDVSAGFDALEALDKNNNKPKVLIAGTIKGQGISFMEHTYCLKKEKDRYMWHNKAPDTDEMEGVYHEIRRRVFSIIKQLGVDDAPFPDIVIPAITNEPPVNGEPLTPAFTFALVNAAKENDKIVVFDADLEADCGLTPFRDKYPGRFFEMGIMEQHMVSSAAAFARMGYFPVINSYTAFLTSRANEQIYNYATEGGNGLITGHMSGIIPATPGKSHQAYRDIACMKNIPGILMYQPATPKDCTSFMKRVFSGEFNKVVYMRMSMAPPAEKLPDAPKNLKPGQSYVLREGKDAVIIGIGPVVLGECMAAAGILNASGISAEVRNHPWLNIFDRSGLSDITDKNVPVLVIEDHYRDGGFGEGFFAAVIKYGLNTGTPVRCGNFCHICIEDFTTTGFRYEILRHFGLDRDSIANKIKNILNKSSG